MKKKVVVAVLLALLVAVVIYLRQPSPKGSDTLRISGNVELTEVQVSFKVPGRVLTRLVDEGVFVRRGDTVATLEDAELLDALRAAQAEADASAATLAELKAGSRREEIAQGEALLDRAEAEARRVSADYQRGVALYAKEVIPRRELEAALAAHDQTRATVRERRLALQLLRKGARQERVDEAQARLQGALRLCDAGSADLRGRALQIGVARGAGSRGDSGGHPRGFGAVLAQGVHPGD